MDPKPERPGSAARRSTVQFDNKASVLVGLVKSLKSAKLFEEVLEYCDPETRELRDRIRHQFVRVACLHGVECRAERAGFVEPRTRRTHVRVARPAAPPIPDAEGESARSAVDWIDQPGRTDVACPSDACRRQQTRIVLGNRCENLWGIVDPVDPVCAAWQGQVAVAVDHARHDRQPGGIDHLQAFDWTWVRLAIARADPADHPVVHQHTDAQLQTV